MADDAGQFHFSPDFYGDLIRSEVPAYDELQAVVAASTSDITPVARVLDLGAGTGVTSAAVLSEHPDALFTLLDESTDMLGKARDLLPADQVDDVVVRDLGEDLPPGSYDLVVSALAVHHLDGPGKQALFERIRTALRPGGRFVMGDVVVPTDPADAVTPLTPEYDLPDRVDDLTRWLVDAGLEPSVRWSSRDLVVIAADAPRPR